MSEHFYKEQTINGVTTRVDLGRMYQLATGELNTLPITRKVK